MAIRYSDNVNGSAANNGTSALTPKADPTEHTTSNGDIHYIKGTGVPYSMGAANNLGLNLSSKSNITVQAWPGYDKPIITHTYAGGGSPRALFFDAGDNVAEDLIFMDCEGGAISTNGAAGASLTVRRCEGYRIGMGRASSTGTFIGAGYSTTIDRVLIEDCIGESCGDDSVFLKASQQVKIINSTFRFPSAFNSLGDCIQVEGACADFLVQNCYLENNKDAKQGAIQSNGTSGFTRYIGNTFVGPTGTVSNFQSCYSDQPALIAGNLFRTKRIAILIKGGGVITGNLILFSGESTEAIYDENVVGGSSLIVNNTIVLADGVTNTAEAIDKKDNTTSRVHNNIIVGAWAQGMLLHSSAATESHNYVYGATYFALNESFAQRTPGTGSSTNDPLLDANYRPTADSPCIAAGTRIADVVLKDFYGKDITDVPDIGAIQAYAARTDTTRTASSARTASTTRSTLHNGRAIPG